MCVCGCVGVGVGVGVGVLRRTVSQSCQGYLPDEPLQEQSPEPRGDAAAAGGGGPPAQEAETRAAGGHRLHIGPPVS